MTDGFDRGRRRFLAAGGALAAGAVFGPWLKPGAALAGTRSVGPVVDPASGRPLLALPEGFRYFSFGWTGEAMTDGRPTPPKHDGMAAVAADGDGVRLVRNHEVMAIDGPLSPEAPVYDPVCGGGTTTLTVDLAEEALLSTRPSLAGTLRNCAGGDTWRGSWLSCEEIFVGPDDRQGGRPLPLEQRHGYVFEVPAEGAATARPLRSMGRFHHEAVAVDRAAGVLYLTEDQDQAGFYRFLPADPDDLAAGGKLQALRVPGRKDLGETVDEDRWDAEWVDVDDPDPDITAGREATDGVFAQARRSGATAFRRLEGCWPADDGIWFTATTGGRDGIGQIFRYRPDGGRLELIHEARTGGLMTHPDNLCVAPGGGLVVCEDGYGSDRAQRLIAFGADGTPRLLAENNVMLPGEGFRGHAGDFRRSEWAGACFSPDGRWLFVNIYDPGVTLAITGPWEQVGV